MTLPYGSLQRIMAAPRRTAAARRCSAPARERLRHRGPAPRRGPISPRRSIFAGSMWKEALRVLDDYLDDAVLAGVGSSAPGSSTARTGTLRRAVWDWLQSHPYVAEYRLGEEGKVAAG